MSNDKLGEALVIVARAIEHLSPVEQSRVLESARILLDIDRHLATIAYEAMMAAKPRTPLSAPRVMQFVRPGALVDRRPRPQKPRPMRSMEDRRKMFMWRGKLRTR